MFTYKKFVETPVSLSNAIIIRYVCKPFRYKLFDSIAYRTDV